MATKDPNAPLRVMLYDRTCYGPGPIPGLTTAWWLGGRLYRGLDRIDAWRGVATWAEAFDWLRSCSTDRKIGEIQFWGHGHWGGLWMDEDVIDAEVMRPGHALYERLATLRDRLVQDGSALWWFRCCDLFGTQIGHDFAREWTRFFGCRAAGHTYTIEFWQSGLHILEPGQEPYWPIDEGVVPGMSHARESYRGAPRTITCLHNTIPEL